MKYVEWLFNEVCDDIHPPKKYQKLLLYLNSRSFYWTLAIDENRAKDGMELRDVYAKCFDISQVEYMELYSKPCSVLEMMIALSNRLETILGVPYKGFIFWKMIENLGLDCEFSEKMAYEVLDAYFSRRFAKDGKGGMFYIPGTSRDMVKAEIWYQAIWYADYISNKMED